MEDENLDIEQQETSNLVSRAGNTVSNFGRGVASGINSGFKSAKSSIDNKSNIPDPKNQNNSNQELPSAEQNKGNGLEDKNDPLNKKDNNKKDKNNKSTGMENKSSGESKDSSISKKSNEEKKHNVLDKFKEKKKESNDFIKEKLLKTGIGKKIKIASVATLVIITIVVMAIGVLIVGLTTSTTVYYAATDPGILCKLNKPLEDPTVTDVFSWRILNGEASAHRGIDLAAGEGTEIYAALSGKISSFNYNDSYGYYIIINHGEIDGKEYETVYAHMSQEVENLGWQVGDSVSKGEVIGYVGNTGLSTGPHLHFEIREDSKKISPNRLYNYEDPTGSCDPSVFDSVSKEKIEELNCGVKEEIGENDNLSNYCPSTDKDAFLQCLETEYEIWQTASYDQKSNMVTKYCTSAGSSRLCEWCSSYVIWCLRETEMLETGGFNQVNAYADSLRYTDKGAYYSRGEYVPEPGDMIFFEWERPSNGYADHVGVVTSVEDGYVYTIEGNTHQGSGSGPLSRNIWKKRWNLYDANIFGYTSW